MTGMCYSAGSAMRHGSSSLTRLTGQSAMTPSTWPDTHVLSISDREGDFYDLFERAEQTPGIKADWLVRMKFNNRATLNINGKRDHRLLHERIMEITPQQLVEFTIPDGRGQQARTLPDMLSSDAGPLSYPLIYSSKVMIISLFDSTVMPDKYRHNGK